MESGNWIFECVRRLLWITARSVYAVIGACICADPFAAQNGAEKERVFKRGVMEPFDPGIVCGQNAFFL